MTADPDDPAITVYIDDAHDTLWALDQITEWLDHAHHDTHRDLAHFCAGLTGRFTADHLQRTITRQATTIRHQLAALNPPGAAID